MKMIDHSKGRGLMVALLIAALGAMLPWQINAQDKSDDPAKRIQQLESENAKLREALEKVKSTSGDDKLAAEISAAEADLQVLRSRYSDQHPAVLQAQKRLQVLKERLVVVKQSAAMSPRQARERELYAQELALARKYADSVRRQLEVGRSTLQELVRAQRQVFGIQREIARLDGNRAQLKEVVHEDINTLQRLLDEVKKQIEVGRAAPGDDLDLQREMFKLKRELLQLEEP